MSAAKLLEGLEKGLQAVEALAPAVAAIIPAAGRVGSLAAELAQIGQLALNDFEGLSETDLEKLSDLTVKLQAKNDELAAAIAAS